MADRDMLADASPESDDEARRRVGEPRRDSGEFEEKILALAAGERPAANSHGELSHQGD